MTKLGQIEIIITADDLASYQLRKFIHQHEEASVFDHPEAPITEISAAEAVKKLAEIEESLRQQRGAISDD